ncbi:MULTISPECIES: helicase-exonuclease AddAB subunit AddB [Clostridia]|uniref:helicase-exonuclease AddAB subunit AddB n=1 Tax=Clostridia TaxID=186801 RepID=UPI000EA0A874|nr:MULTISPECIES: helicase-exonuclease AddAB subunit AddB [Clostridia]NBJ69179.1 helicase-exonuclease AddAB subunit AddB [Roseburia sp. 1XD42-34]RKI79598.1 helicase-exonuclease AddAB subunit AddB [Clostridium sp. 1xD42-85]
MGLRFITGRAGTGKSGRIFDEIKEKLLNRPQGSAIFYIVPDQMTFQQEYKLFKDKAILGSIRAQVVSFSRLAWRVLQATGGGNKQFISTVGMQMLLRKIMEEKQGEWRVFQHAMEKHGFIDQLETMITEFKRYAITPELLYAKIEYMNSYVHKEAGEEGLIHKLEDLLYIYEKLLFSLQGKYMDGEDQLQLLAEKIAHSSFLEGAEIYVDGFYRFTPTELMVVEALLKKCKQVTIALTVDKPEEEPASEVDLFYQTKETYHRLKQMAASIDVTIEATIELDPKYGRFRDRAYFAHLETYFDERPAPIYHGQVPLQIAEAVHPRAEVEGAAQQIIHLVRDKGYRYQDIAIFIRQPDMYHDLIATIFHDYDIPVFIDEKRTMLNHPLMEFIRSSLDVVEGNWRYDAVFRLLKTGFIPSTDKQCPLTADAIDELENYVLEYGVRSRTSWFSEKEWVFQRFRGFEQTAQTDIEKEMQTRINRYRNQVAEAFEWFDKEMREAHTVTDRCTCLYQLLEELQVPTRLEQMRAEYDEQFEIEKGREQEQVWDAVIQLLDEIVEIAGEEAMSLTVFRKTLEAGLNTLKFAHVPPSIDHVIVGSIDRSRISDIRCAFLLGVNEGMWPMKPPADGLINEQERDLLAGHGVQLAETSKRQLLDDWFYMYMSFTVASDQLWISYPLSDEEGNTKMPSQLIKRMESLFPNGCEHLLLQEPDELLEADRFVTTPHKTRAALTAQLSRYRRGYPIKQIWWHVLNWYIKHEEKYATTHRILQSLYYQNKPSNLSKETVEKLYPKQIKASVSRLETYYRCSYQHFAKYSLGLEERRTYKLDAPDIGQLFHEALKTITEWVQKGKKEFSQLTQADASAYAHQAVTKLSPILQHQILHSSNRYQYIQQKLEEVIARATYVLSEQARKSHFSPVGLELGFGNNQDLPPLTIPLRNGFELMLRGRIDRVDKAVKEDDLFLRIIDYKSSAKELNLLEVYYGLALQMLAYLDVVITYSEQWLGVKATPAGVLYFHVHNPMIVEKDKLDDATIEKELFKKYKMQGLLLADEDIAKLMDVALESGTSQIIPAAIKKNGGFYSYSRIADEQTFKSLQQHVHHLMVQAGMDMTHGGIHLNPYYYKQQVACTHCPFQSVCQFDPTIPTNNYRKLTDMKQDEILKQIRKKEEPTW